MQKSIHFLVAAALLTFTLPASAEEHEAQGISFDGLVQIEGSASEAAYIDPDVDFSIFRRVAILEPHVAFRSNWMRDQNRTRRTNRVQASDMERIREDVGSLLKEVFTEQLEAAGYEVVNFADEDVLVVRAAIIDLDVTAPDLRNSTTARSYVSDAGSATLYVELYDAMTGDILGRAADRRTAGNRGSMTFLANRVTNRSEARKMFRVWADRLVNFLDEHYVKPETAE